MNIKLYSRVLIGTLLVPLLGACVSNKTFPYLNKSCLSSGKSFINYTDKYDRVSIKIRFQDGRQFSNGLAAVKFDGKWGYINSFGDVIIPFQYDWVSSFGEFGFDCDVAIVKNDINKERMPMFSACPSWLINKKGKVITQEYGVIFPIERNLSIVNNGSVFKNVGKSFAASEGKWGAINKNGDEVISCEYDLMYPFRDVVTFVQKNGKWGMIDEKGKELIPCEYDDVVFYGENISINTFMEIKGEEKYNMLKDGLIYMFLQNEKIRFDKKGRRVY